MAASVLQQDASLMFVWRSLIILCTLMLLFLEYLNIISGTAFASVSDVITTL